MKFPTSLRTAYRWAQTKRQEVDRKVLIWIKWQNWRWNVNLIPPVRSKFDIADSISISVENRSCLLNWNLVLRNRKEKRQGGCKTDLSAVWPARSHKWHISTALTMNTSVTCPESHYRGVLWGSAVLTQSCCGFAQTLQAYAGKVRS
jgi:hypothetical protein